MQVKNTLVIFAALFSAAVTAQAASLPVNVLTQHNNNARTGANLQETTLNTSNVNVKQFGKLFTRTVEGYLYAQPLYVQGLPMPGKGRRNVVFLATSHNSVYAFDADDPKAFDPLWQVNLGPSVPASEVYTTIWTDMLGEIGITSTPVIDLPNKTIFVEAKTKENGTYVQKLHALDITTGHEKPGSPVEIQASVPGTGEDSENGVVAFNPVKELQRPGLLLSGGVVYLAFGSHADSQPFHGWILGYNAATLKQVSAFNTTPNGAEGAIWQAGMGLAADDTGNIFAMTGNGTFSADSGGSDYGDSILKLTPGPGGLKVTDYFTPFNQLGMNQADLDLGGSGPLLLPGTRMLLGGGKNGWLYLVQQNHLGHYQSDSDSQIVQNFRVTPGNFHGSPVFWNSPGGPTAYIWGELDHLKAFRLSSGKFDPTPASQSDVVVPLGMPGGFLSVSANGSAPGTGIVWSCAPYADNANWRTVPGVFRAYDASDLTKELWDDKMNPTRDDMGMFAKFCAPTIANGKVYVATFGNQLQVYGLLPLPPVPAIQAVTATRSHVIVTFSAPVTGDTAQAAKYTLDHGAAILRTSLDANQKAVYLATTPLQPGQTYRLTVSGSSHAFPLTIQR